MNSSIFCRPTPTVPPYQPRRLRVVGRLGRLGRLGRRSRPGFSLLEAVVVIGILAALVAILVPVCSRARQSARDVVCAARLRYLALACAAYLTDNGTYPLPLQDTRSLPSGILLATPVPTSASLQPMPHNGQTRLFNDLAGYLRFPRIVRAVPAVDLPPAVQCPSVEPVSDGRGPAPTVGAYNYSYFTGYDYLVGLDRDTVPTTTAPAGATLPPLPALPVGGTLPGLPVPLPSLSPVTGLLNLPPGSVLKPGRAAGIRGGPRAVLWVDDVRLAMDSTSPQGGYWVFAHAQNGAAPGAVPLSAAQPAGCRGQHRAHTDSSVEWYKGNELGLPQQTLPTTGAPGPALPGLAGSLLDPFASLKLGSSYWWY